MAKRWQRFFLLLIFSIALMSIDHLSDFFAPVRISLSVINLPIDDAVLLPKKVHAWFEANYPDDSLYQKYVDLKKQKQTLEARLQRYDGLQKQNERLAELLDISSSSKERVSLAEVIEIGMEPFTHRIVLDRGKEFGVYLGQPVVSKDGVLGQISEIGYGRSVVTLITDPSHALPVQIQRNGLRTIVRGLGESGRVEIPFLSAQADIRGEDILVTSGIGGGFPANYKVAKVREVAIAANKAFVEADAIPFARIDNTIYVLLLWSADSPQNSRDNSQ